MPMDRLATSMTDRAEANAARIAALFPSVVTETRDAEGRVRLAVDFDLLRQELSGVLLESGKERYQLTWPGKRETILAANAPLKHTLRPVMADSVHWDSTRNAYIEGDNLQALKLLRHSYANRVKCIYIDPPYNTGKDMIYKDDFRMDADAYLEESGQVDGEGNRLFRSTESSGRFHSDWLSEMYPRLKVARDMLREDGVIFISIDDHEMVNLKLLCDEVFGGGNFVANLIWANKEGGGGSDSKHFRVKHEYILCYAKSLSDLVIKGIGISNAERYRLQDQHAKSRGSYYLQKLNQASIRYSASLDYPITAPDGTRIMPAIGSKQACWRWSKAKVEWGLEHDFIVMKKDYQGEWQVYTKQYMHVDNHDQPIVRTNRPLGLIEAYSSTQASKKLEELFGAKVFHYSKPYELIQYLLSLTTEGDDLVVDFFSGSATTAHAVMRLNAEDGGSRSYIMIQLPEATAEGSEAYKAGYVNICEIGKERIRRAANSVKSETGAAIDYGFRVYRLDDAYMERGGRTSGMEDEPADGAWLVQALLELGLELTLPMGTRTIEGRTIHQAAGNVLTACFGESLPEPVIEAMARQQPQYAVFRSRSFADAAACGRAEQRFGMLSPGTAIRVL
ncbi:site-specific DNA-methyltransferase [Paenibacillus lycopersici]|nr:site-specific DNA-methyltransferase [Paenibacillus lycopersici]